MAQPTLRLLLGPRSPAVRIMSSDIEYWHVVMLWYALFAKGNSEVEIVCWISNVKTVWELFALSTKQTNTPLPGHAVLGSLGVLALETAGDIHRESPSKIQMTSYMGSTHASLRTAVPYHQMRFNKTAYFKHGATICLQRGRIRPIDKMYQDCMTHFHDWFKTLSSWTSLTFFRTGFVCLKAGRDTPSATWRTLSPMKPKSDSGVPKCTACVRSKFEAKQIFGAFGPPNGTKFKDTISTRQLESKWPQPDLPIKT